MRDLLTLCLLIIWPIIPLLWIPLHFRPSFFRKLGRMTYGISGLVWLLMAWIISSYKDILLSYVVMIPHGFASLGIVLLFGGTMIHIWTLRLLTFSGITGGYELENRHDVLCADGAFAIVRHPTYLAHTLMFLGIFFITRHAAAGWLTLTDFVVVQTLIIPLEERELTKRFGDDYERYRERVPRFFPHIRL